MMQNKSSVSLFECLYVETGYSASSMNIKIDMYTENIIYPIKLRN